MVDNKNQENQDNQYLRIFIKTFTVLFLTMGIVTLIINLYFSVNLFFDKGNEDNLDWKIFLLYMFLFPLMPGFWHFIVKRGDGGSHLHDLEYPGKLFKLGWLKLKDS